MNWYNNSQSPEYILDNIIKTFSVNSKNLKEMKMSRVAMNDSIRASTLVEQILVFLKYFNECLKGNLPISEETGTFYTNFIQEMEKLFVYLQTYNTLRDKQLEKQFDINNGISKIKIVEFINKVIDFLDKVYYTFRSRTNFDFLDFPPNLLSIVLKDRLDMLA